MIQQRDLFQFSFRVYIQLFRYIPNGYGFMVKYLQAFTKKVNTIYIKRRKKKYDNNA